MINVEHLSFGYSRTKMIFRDISFCLEPGEVMCVLGPNGVGKTSLLKTVMGILSPLSGNCAIELVKGRKAKLAYVSQAKKVPFSYNVVDFVSFGCRTKKGFFSAPCKEDISKAESVLIQLGAARLAAKHVNQISGGELQLCYIAKALVSEPDILILDEPEANLDFRNQNIIVQLLKDLSEKQNMTIIMNTHYIDHAEALADKCLLMNKCSYVYGDKKDVFNENLLSDCFKVPIRKHLSMGYSNYTDSQI
ncbi:ABC transporter ATP-binding protein [Klebsiella aerogenes]|uniref:ABC transporter ATP-binding protein n=1 Tax=Klebsiella aerogenes TaxID=548 RepID=UPI0018687C90|nr:ABC transporter ATP-binding protein [Klebsiella aerogenes]